jgi:hypothetical protein
VGESQSSWRSSRDGAVVAGVPPRPPGTVIESWWSQFASECQRLCHPPRLNHRAHRAPADLLAPPPPSAGERAPLLPDGGAARCGLPLPPSSLAPCTRAPVIESWWVAQPLALAGELRPPRLNDRALSFCLCGRGAVWLSLSCAAAAAVMAVREGKWVPAVVSGVPKGQSATVPTVHPPPRPPAPILNRFEPPKARQSASRGRATPQPRPAGSAMSAPAYLSSPASSLSRAP